jgi:hypothetical protein
MIAEIRTNLIDIEDLKIKLGIQVELDVATLQVDFTISRYLPATFHEPSEGGDLEVDDCCVMYVTDIDDQIIELSEEQCAIVHNHLDFAQLDRDCYALWGDRNE